MDSQSLATHFNSLPSFTTSLLTSLQNKDTILIAIALITTLTLSTALAQRQQQQGERSL